MLGLIEKFKNFLNKITLKHFLDSSIVFLFFAMELSSNYSRSEMWFYLFASNLAWAIAFSVYRYYKLEG